MRRPIPDGGFKPKPTSSEAKADVTTRVARSILGAEMAAREAKTERLRLARLAKEAEARPAGNTNVSSSGKKDQR